MADRVPTLAMLQGPSLRTDRYFSAAAIADRSDGGRAPRDSVSLHVARCGAGRAVSEGHILIAGGNLLVALRMSRVATTA